MPNTFGGNKFKKGKKVRVRNTGPLLFADEIDGCYYGQIIKRIGTGFFVMINDKQETATICGKMRNRQWCNPGDIVMVNLDLDKYIITHKYSPDEVRQLKSLGKINFGNSEDNDGAVVFDDDDSDDDVFDTMNELRNQQNRKNTKVTVQSKVNDVNNVNSVNKENKELGSESDSESDSESEEQPVQEQDQKSDQKSDKEDKIDKDLKTKKLNKQFKNKDRGNKIVSEINKASERNVKTQRTVIDDDFIDNI